MLTVSPRTPLNQINGQRMNTKLHLTVSALIFTLTVSSQSCGCIGNWPTVSNAPRPIRQLRWEPSAPRLVNHSQYFRNANVGKCHIVQWASWPRITADRGESSFSEGGSLRAAVTLPCVEPTAPQRRGTKQRDQTLKIYFLQTASSSLVFYAFFVFFCYCCYCCCNVAGEEAPLRLINFLFQTWELQWKM